MTHGDGVKAHSLCKVIERAELDIFVAKDIWIGCESSFISLQKLAENIIPILFDKIFSQDREV